MDYGPRDARGWRTTISNAILKSEGTGVMYLATHDVINSVLLDLRLKGEEIEARQERYTR